MTETHPASFSENHAAIARRAADYALRRRLGDWSKADQTALDAWLAESYLHQAAYLRYAGGVARFKSLAGLREREPRRRFPGVQFVIPFLAAASVILTATLAYPYVRAWLQPPDRSFATNVGGRATLKFADGTLVELNTDTAVRYRMTTRERKVWLEKGEAYFHVAHNAANPFTVDVDGHRITDLGTEFLVRAVGDLDVVLVKGRAQIASDKSGAAAAMLVPGDEAVASTGGVVVTRRTPQELADELAWRRGVVVFRKTPLSDAVREFNRYNEVKLVIADPSISNLKFSAELTTDDFADFIELAQSVLKVRADRIGDEIRLSRG